MRTPRVTAARQPMVYPTISRRVVESIGGKTFPVMTSSKVRNATELGIGKKDLSTNRKYAKASSIRSNAAMNAIAGMASRARSIKVRIDGLGLFQQVAEQTVTDC